MSSFDPITKIWSGPKVKRDEDERTFRQTIFHNLKLTPNKIFQISDSENKSLTYSEVELLSIRVAQNLLKFGVDEGDVVSVLLGNCSDLAPIVIGCILIGALINPITIGNSEYLLKCFSTTRPKLIILKEFSSDVLDVADKLQLGCKIFVHESCDVIDSKVCNLKELFKETQNETKFKVKDGTDTKHPIFVIPSSGTTGVPKSVVVSDEYCKLIKYAWDLRENVVVFSYSTLSWLTGIYHFMFALLNNGIRVVTSANSSAKNCGEIVRKYKVTTGIVSVKLAMELYNSADFKSSDYLSVKEFFCGGERTPQFVREFLKENFPKGSFRLAYGMTEVSIVAYTKGDDDTLQVTSNVTGTTRENVSCKIIGEAGQNLGIGEIGQILAKGEFSFCGYYGNPGLSKNALDDEGWYKTGDVGFFDEHEMLHVFGRNIHMIEYNGRKFHPAEIEGVIENVGGIKIVCCVLAPFGDRNVLTVLVEKSSESNVTANDLSLKAAKLLPQYEFHGGFHIVESIPRTFNSASKIQRELSTELAAQILKGV